MHIVLEGAAGRTGAAAQVVLNDHKRLIEARPNHVTGEVAIDIDAGLAARIHMADLRGRRSPKGMPEDAETREVKTPAEHAPRRRVQPVKLVHDEDHVL